MSGMTARLLTSAIVVGALFALVGCSTSPMPNPKDPRVRAQALQMATVAAASQNADSRAAGVTLTEPWTCTGTLWGVDADALLGVVNCTAVLDGDTSPAVTTPVRVEGDTATFPADGSEFEPTLRTLWGDELAARYLASK